MARFQGINGQILAYDPSLGTRDGVGMTPHTIAVLGLTYPFRGGIAHYSTILVRELRRTYRDVRFFALSRQYPAILFPGKTQYDDSQTPIVEGHVAIIDSINPLTWIRTAWRLKREAPDLVVIQWWNPFFGLAFGTIANLVTLISNIKICFLCHNVLPHESSRFDKLLLRYAFCRVTYFIVHSEEDRAHLLALRPDAVVQHNVHPTYAVFGDLKRYEKDEARRTLNLSIGQNVILFFGLIRQYKGLQYLIRAMPKVLRRINCTLLIAGEFYDSKETYLALIADLGLEANTIVVDQYISNEEVSLYFCSADVVILPYVDATQSGIVQIAYGLGVPVITTRVGGLPEAVEDGKTGLLVEKESPEELAKAIIDYYTGGHEAAFRRAIENNATQFGWDAELSNLASFLLETRKVEPGVL
jgi:glycosyltransferase involved in cell wall biosynthesis